MKHTIRLALPLAAALVAFAAAAPAAHADAAKDAFDHGIELYKAKDYDGASAELEKAYGLAPDVKTLFAWAQSERFAGRCDHSIELFGKLLGEKLTDANRTAVERNISECKAQLAAEPPKPPADHPPADHPPADQPPTPPPPDERPPDDIIRIPERPVEAKRPWYKNTVGVALLGGGVAALGVGIGVYVAAVGKDSSADDAMTYAEFADRKDKARRLSQIGIVAGVAGVALIGAGVVDFMLGGDDDERESGVTVSVTGDGAAIGWSGGF